MQFTVGDSRNRIWIQCIHWIERHDGDMHTTYLAGSGSLTYLCDVTSESRANFEAKSCRKHCENVEISLKMHAVEHIGANKASKEGT